MRQQFRNARGSSQRCASIGEILTGTPLLKQSHLLTEGVAAMQVFDSLQVL
jgi:hypothetical protein